ncbi:MAG: phospholipase D family protein [Desulforhopalus sp.]
MYNNSGYLIFFVFLFILEGCASLPDNSHRTFSFAYPAPEQATIAQKFTEELNDHPDESGYLLLDNGMDAFIARAALAHVAEHTIDAQYYLLHHDTLGGLFVDQLFKAADRGVRVRLLLDDMGLEGRDFNLAVVDDHPNIEVRIFNPFGRNVGRAFQFITGFGKQTRRSHNKSFTVDNFATILGGRNIGNEYFIADPKVAFLDLDVLAIGPVAKGVSASFDQFWNHRLSYPVATLTEKMVTPEEGRQAKIAFDEFIDDQQDSDYLRQLKKTDLANTLRNHSVDFVWAKGQIVADAPDKITTHTSNTAYHLAEELGPYLDNTTKDLLIISPYFVPGKSGIDFFKQLRGRNVRVRILTNSLASNDVSLVHSGYAKYRRALLKMGVELYELNSNLAKETRKEGSFYESKSSLHAKTFVIDKEEVFIGSLNLDPRSVIENTEIGIIIESPELAGELDNAFTRGIDKVAFRLELKTDNDGFEYIVWHGLVDGKQQTLFAEPHTSFWQRFTTGVLRLLPVESQL